MTKRLRFTSKSYFFSTLKKRVDHYFDEKQINRHANSAMWIKAIIFLTGFFLCYGIIISGIFSLYTMLITAILLGMFSAFVGFNICTMLCMGLFRQTNM